MDRGKSGVAGIREAESLDLGMRFQCASRSNLIWAVPLHARLQDHLVRSRRSAWAGQLNLQTSRRLCSLMSWRPGRLCHPAAALFRFGGCGRLWVRVC